MRRTLHCLTVSITNVALQHEYILPAQNFPACWRYVIDMSCKSQKDVKLNAFNQGRLEVLGR